MILAVFINANDIDICLKIFSNIGNTLNINAATITNIITINTKGYVIAS